MGGRQFAEVGDNVRARVVCRTNNPAAIGFESIAFKLFVDGWLTSTDQLSPWSQPSASTDTTTLGTNGPGVRDSVRGNGRFAPFGQPNALGLPTTMVDTSQLWIEDSFRYWMSVGQLPVPLARNDTGNFFDPSIPADIFQFTFTVGASHLVGETLSFGVQLHPTAAGEMHWYDNRGGFTTFSEGHPRLELGSVVVVPTPGATLILVGMGLMRTRRRR